VDGGAVVEGRPDLTTLDAGLVKNPITDASTRSNAVEPVTSSAV